jgi:hypothetical protein
VNGGFTLAYTNGFYDDGIKTGSLTKRYGFSGFSTHHLMFLPDGRMHLSFTNSSIRLSPKNTSMRNRAAGINGKYSYFSLNSQVFSKASIKVLFPLERL